MNRRSKLKFIHIWFVMFVCAMCARAATLAEITAKVNGRVLVNLSGVMREVCELTGDVSAQQYEEFINVVINGLKHSASNSNELAFSRFASVLSESVIKDVKDRRLGDELTNSAVKAFVDFARAAEVEPALWTKATSVIAAFENGADSGADLARALRAIAHKVPSPQYDYNRFFSALYELIEEVPGSPGVYRYRTGVHWTMPADFDVGAGVATNRKKAYNGLLSYLKNLTVNAQKGRIVELEFAAWLAKNGYEIKICKFYKRVGMKGTPDIDIAVMINGNWVSVQVKSSVASLSELVANAKYIKDELAAITPSGRVTIGEFAKRIRIALPPSVPSADVAGDFRAYVDEVVEKFAGSNTNQTLVENLRNQVRSGCNLTQSTGPFTDVEILSMVNHFRLSHNGSLGPIFDASF